MERPGLRDLLVRSVLDLEFRDAVRSDPDAAFEGFDLSEPEKAALRRGDGSVLGLPGTVPGDRSADGGSDEAAPAASPPETAEPPPLTIRLLLRVMQSLDAVAGGQGQLHFTAALQPLAEGADPAAMPSPEVDAGILPGTRLDDIALEIRVMPHVGRSDSGGFDVSFQHAVLPVAKGPVAKGPVAAGTPAGTDTGVVAPALLDRAEAVRRAAPEQRYEALLDLIGALGEDAADA